MILHAGHAGNQFMLWGEKSGEEATRTRARSASPTLPKSSSAGPQRYSHDAGRGLAKTIRGLNQGFHSPAWKAQDAVARLPTRANTPLPSSPLTAESPGSRGKLKLAPWTVTVYSFSQEETVALLCACMGKRMLAAGVILGPDLAY